MSADWPVLALSAVMTADQVGMLLLADLRTALGNTNAHTIVIAEHVVGHFALGRAGRPLKPRFFRLP